jgi:hypothetical protein
MNNVSPSPVVKAPTELTRPLSSKTSKGVVALSPDTSDISRNEKTILMRVCR